MRLITATVFLSVAALFCNVSLLAQSQETTAKVNPNKDNTNGFVLQDGFMYSDDGVFQFDDLTGWTPAAAIQNNAIANDTCNDSQTPDTTANSESNAIHQLSVALADSLCTTSEDRNRMQSTIMAAFRVITENVRLENELKMAELKLAHAREVSEMRFVLGQRTQQANNATHDLKQWLGVLNTNQNRTSQQMQLLLTSAETTSKALATLEKQMNGPKPRFATPEQQAAYHAPITTWTPTPLVRPNRGTPTVKKATANDNPNSRFPPPANFLSDNRMNHDQSNPAISDQNGNMLYPTRQGMYVLPKTENQQPVNAATTYQPNMKSWQDEELARLRGEMQALEEKINAFRTRRMLSPMHPPENALAPIKPITEAPNSQQPNPYQR